MGGRSEAGAGQKDVGVTFLSLFSHQADRRIREMDARLRGRH